MTQLRDYQQDAFDAAKQAFARGLQRIGISAPTGAGKSHIMAAMAGHVHANGGTTLTLLHRDTLVDQTVRRYADFVPASAIGVVKAARNEVNKPVVIASVHSLRTDARLAQLRQPSLTIVDEAHVSVSDLYMRVYKHLGTLPGSNGHLIGFTATWTRSDKRGLGDVFEEIVWRRSIKWAVERGILVPPRALQLGGSLDLSDVRIGSDGDYIERDLSVTVMSEELRDTVVRGYLQMANGRSSVLFAPTQESARYFGEALKAAGVSVAEIFSSTGKNVRRYAFAAFDNGAVKVLITCTALAEGWDMPRCDTALLLRPTRHVGLFIQQVGRVLRPWPGKTEALILDFVGVTDDKDMRSVIDLSITPDKEELPECAFCGTPMCPACEICTSGQCPKGMCECEPDEESEPEQREHIAKRINGVHSVDLFAGTNARWLKTRNEVPFIATRDHLIFVSQVNGAWNVGRCSGRTLNGGRWLAEGISSSDALEVGSEAALELDPSIADKRSSWRQGNRTPSPEQIAYAQQLGIDTAGMNKAAVADAISVAKASRVLARIGRMV